MKNRIVSKVTFTLLLVMLLIACENSSEEANDVSDIQSENNNSSQNTNDDSSNVNPTESTTNPDDNKDETIDQNNDHSDKTEITSNNEPIKEEPPATDTSLKEEYLKKLDAAKTETEALEPTDPSTFAMKKMENDRWEIWDKLLNEIYGVLNEQLPPEEMDQLREEQRNWITYRDDSALEASLKFKGGTQEHLEYVSVLANLTEERCYELVEDYMR